MQILSYRLTHKRHLNSAFDGEGARLNGGRWNSIGTSIVYTSDSLALCCLEIIVHLPSYNLLRDYVYMRVAFDSEVVIDAHLNNGWDQRPASTVSQTIGDTWVEDGTAAVLRVPSVIIPESFNYLINIHHGGYDKIKISKPAPVQFDPRLIKDH